MKGKEQLDTIWQKEYERAIAQGNSPYEAALAANLVRNDAKQN